MKIKGLKYFHISKGRVFSFIHIEPGDCTKYQFLMMIWEGCIYIASAEAAQFVGSEWRIKDIIDFNNEFSEWDYKNSKMVMNPFIMNMADNAKANSWTCVAACMAAKYFIDQIGGLNEKGNGIKERARQAED